MIDSKRLAEVMARPILRGAHSPDGKMCVMEAVAYVAGEPWSDRPMCASRVLTDFCVSWNDAMGDEDRQILKPFIPRLVNTKASLAVDRRRSYMALDWYCRVSTPTWLRLAGLISEAEAIEATAPIVDAASAGAARRALNSARTAAAAAGDAARDAARAAARDAARAAARAAAWDAARAAAWDAAGDAARAAAWAAAGDAARAAAGAAAWAAARDAAWDALRPTVVELQKSALDLLDRMILAS
jgi:hypothetical protein